MAPSTKRLDCKICIKNAAVAALFLWMHMSNLITHFTIITSVKLVPVWPLFLLALLLALNTLLRLRRVLNLRQPFSYYVLSLIKFIICINQSVVQSLLHKQGLFVLPAIQAVKLAFNITSVEVFFYPSTKACFINCYHSGKPTDNL